MPFRYDAGPTLTAQELPNGFLRAPAILTRVGVFPYRQPDGTTRLELRPPEEVFDAESLASFSMVPLTLEHPATAVTADNVKALQVGHVGDSVRQEGEHVAAPLMITDARAVEDVKSGKRRELSCGYFMELDATPGVWKGERYDAVQRRIRGNHVALTERGRAGPAVGVRMDASDAVMISPSEDTPGAPRHEGRQDTKEPTVSVKQMKINGVTYELPEQAAQALEAERARQDSDAEALKKRAEEATARADAADKARNDAADPQRFNGAVAARVKLEREARSVLGEGARLDAMDDAQVRAAALAKLCPTLKLDGREPSYVAARFDAEIERASADALRKLREDSTPKSGANPGTPKEGERKDAAVSFMEASASAWQKPLSASAES